LEKKRTGKSRGAVSDDEMRKGNLRNQIIVQDELRAKGN